MSSINGNKRTALLATSALALAACGASGDKDGTLTVRITVSPIDRATAVAVVFTSVELKPASGGDAAARSA
jgi:ABC-type metal ion transport system substrate-binding protein